MKDSKLVNNIYKKNLIITGTASTENLSSIELYTENLVEIDLVVAGSGIHRVSDRLIPCKEGEMCVLCPFTSHGYEKEDGGKIEVLRILFNPQDFFEGSFGDKKHPQFCYGAFCEGASISYATLNKESRAEIEASFRGVFREAERKQNNWDFAVKAHLSVMLITLSRYMNSAIKDNSSVSMKEKDLISSALHILNEDFTSESLTLESVAESLFISPAQLSRSFKHGVGKSFSDYLRELRMMHACNLLKETDQSVSQILYSCGLKDLPSFYRNFQQFTNMTPNQYRGKYNKNHTSISKGEKIMVILGEVSENLQKGRGKIVKEMVEQALAEGCDPVSILNEGLLHGMGIIGEKFKNNEVFVPEVLVAARAMNMGISVLKPHLMNSGVESTGKVCIGTVQGDLHDIGKNLVKMMMEGKGLEVVDLGVDVPPETFINTAKEQGCQIICCSALLTTTMGVMSEVVKAADEAGIRGQVKIMIGGAPVNEDFCKEIGADCYTADAASAADAAVELCRDI